MTLMSHVAGPHVLDALGALAGALGIAIALFLSMVSRRDVPASWILAFFTTGSVLLFLHVEIFGGLAVSEVLFVRTVGIAVAFTAEVAALVYVLRSTSVPTVREAVENAYHHAEQAAGDRAE